MKRFSLFLILVSLSVGARASDVIECQLARSGRAPKSFTFSIESPRKVEARLFTTHDREEKLKVTAFIRSAEARYLGVESEVVREKFVFILPTELRELEQQTSIEVTSSLEGLVSANCRLSRRQASL
jgi:hypothetical protein